MLRKALTWLLNPVLDWLTDPKKTRRNIKAKKPSGGARKYVLMTKEKRALLKKYLQEQIPADVIAERLGVHQTTVRRHYKFRKRLSTPAMVVNNTVEETGGHPEAWKTLRGFRRQKTASVPALSVYATLRDDLYMSPRDVCSGMRKTSSDLPSVQSCLSALARMGILHRKLRDTTRTKGYVYRRVRKDEPIEVKILWTKAA